MTNSGQNEAVRHRPDQKRHVQRRHYPTTALQRSRRAIQLHVSPIPYNKHQLTIRYRQNPSVRQSTDTTGKTTTVNVQEAKKVLTYLIKYDDETPTKPREPTPPVSSLDKGLQETIKVLTTLFESQPIWTRRGLRNTVKTPEQRQHLRQAIPYVGYIFRSGPWRDAIVRFGVDPRSSPKYRIYQTFMFKILPRDPGLARDGGAGRRHNLPRTTHDASILEQISESQDPTAAGTAAGGTNPTHIFTGNPPLHRDGRIWLACDLTDPILHSTLFPSSPPANFINTTCEPISDGWFGNGTLAKIKTIMRTKITALSDGRVEDDAVFRKILTLPDRAASERDVSEGFVLEGEDVGNRDLLLATEVRSAIRGAPNWRGFRYRMRVGGEGSGKGERERESEGEGEGEEEELEQAERMEEAEAEGGDGDEVSDEE